MPTARSEAYAAASGWGSGKLWNAHEHKRGILLGLMVDNQYGAAQKIKLYDGFVTDASKVVAGGGTQSAEYMGASNLQSGLVRLEITVPAGETAILGKEDCEGIEFLGQASVVGGVTSSDCIIIARYKLV